MCLFVAQEKKRGMEGGEDELDGWQPHDDEDGSSYSPGFDTPRFVAEDDEREEEESENIRVVCRFRYVNIFYLIMCLIKFIYTCECSIFY